MRRVDSESSVFIQMQGSINLDAQARILPLLEPSAVEEEQRLINNPDQEDTDKQSDLTKIIAIGLNSLLLATHLIGNGIILSSLGSDETAAASLISGIQAVCNGSMFGVLLNAGILIGPAIANKDDKEAGLIIKSSWLLGLSLSSIAVAALLSMRAFLPQMIEPGTARAVNDYFLTYSWGAFFDIVNGNNGIIINLVENNWVFPLFAAAIYRLPSLGLGYLFARHFGMGAKGVGLGSTVAGLNAFLIIQAWFFFRKTYKNYGLYKPSIPNLLNRLKVFLQGGWKLALLILSEWGDTTAIAIWIGILSNSAVEALQPSIQVNTLVALSLQGMGHASMVFLGRDCALQQKHYLNYQKTLSRRDLVEYKKLVTASKRSFLVNNFAALLLCAVLSASIYAARKPIINLFLPSAGTQQYNLAEDFMFYGIIALMADSQRIMTAGMLRGWNDLLFPTLVSVLFMIVIGVPAGGLISMFGYDGNTLPFYWLRIATIILSYFAIVGRFGQQIYRDEKRFDVGAFMPSVFNKLTHWVKKSSRETSYENDDEIAENVYEQTGLRIVDNKMKDRSLFSTLSAQIGTDEDDYDARQLKILATQKLTPELYHHVCKRSDKGLSFQDIDLDDGINTLEEVCIKSLSEVLDKNIVIIDDAGKLVTAATQHKFSGANTFYLLRSSEGGYFNLSGIPRDDFVTNLIAQTGNKVSLAASCASLFKIHTQEPTDERTHLIDFSVGNNSS